MKAQQGDIILQQTDVKIKGKKQKDLIIAKSDVSGHSHRIEKGNAKIIESIDKIRYLQVLSDSVMLKHEEHKQIKVSKGNYLIKIVREFDAFEKEIRQVRD